MGHPTKKPKKFTFSVDLETGVTKEEMKRLLRVNTGTELLFRGTQVKALNAAIEKRLREGKPFQLSVDIS